MYRSRDALTAREAGRWNRMLHFSNPLLCILFQYFEGCSQGLDLTLSPLLGIPSHSQLENSLSLGFCIKGKTESSWGRADAHDLWSTDHTMNNQIGETH